MRSFYRGGNYNSTNAYSFPSFNGNNDRSNANGNIGFRSASVPQRQISHRLKGLPSVRGIKGIRFLGLYKGRKTSDHPSAPKGVEAYECGVRGGGSMDRHRGLFERFTSFETQYSGYLLARRCKRYKPEVLSYSANLEENLIDGINHLIWKDYQIAGAHEFYEYFPKKRIITAWPFRYRVINCAAYQTLWPIYSRSMYEHSYGSIPGKGCVSACCTIQKWMRATRQNGKYPWVGKADISKFFFRIPHTVQLRELGRPIDDPDMMWFLETSIRGDGRPTGLPLECGDPTEAERIFGIGMPVGSLISQMTANVVLTPVDHFMKRTVRIPRYARYMDDMFMMGESKQQIWDALGALNLFLKDQMGLQLNHKTAVMPFDEGVEFVGKVIRPDRITVRKATSLKMKRHLRYVREAYGRGEVPLEYALSVITSYIGLLEHTDCDALKKKLREDFVLVTHVPEEYPF